MPTRRWNPCPVCTGRGVIQQGDELRECTRCLDGTVVGRSGMTRLSNVEFHVNTGGKVETRGVLTGAYKSRHPTRRINARMLTHTVAILREPDIWDLVGDNVKVLCHVKPSSLADGPPADLAQSEPTCPTCRRRDPRFMSEKPPQISDTGGKVIDLMAALKKSLEPR